MLAVNSSQNEIMINKLSDIVGKEYVLLSQEDREFYAMDVYKAGALPLAIVQPGSIDELCAIVKLASDNQIAIVPRGGGASYTDAYLPTSEQSLLVDTSRLNNIVEINEEDMYVTVECGVNWAQLDAALQKKGLRTPFWGPFSGQKATIGGSMTQGTASMGSGTYGTSADSALGFEVVLANGELLRTGSHAAANGTPFFRHYGPDLTGLFTNDAGALGVKARITLALIKRPKFNGTCSFGFDDFESMSKALAAVAREGVADINMALDPVLQQGQLVATSFSDVRRAAFAVFTNSRNVFEGVWRLLKLAITGKRFFGSSPYSAHFIVDGQSQAMVNSKLASVRQVASPHGTEIAASVPTVVIAMPFIPLNGIVGARGERCLPQHGIMPFSKVVECHKKLRSLFDANQDAMQANKIIVAEMYTTIGHQGFLYEPVFYWEDSRTAFTKRYLLPDEYVNTLPVYDDNPKARELIEKLRVEIQAIFTEVGAVHLQIGKSYPYLKDRQPMAADLISQIKGALDPELIMNPGALDGLNQH